LGLEEKRSRETLWLPT